MNTLGSTVFTAIQSGLQKNFTEAMRTIVVPTYEKTSEELLRQVQGIFVKGTKSCE